MHSFFGLQVPQDSMAVVVASLVLALVLGGLIGMERELTGHPAGLRTHILVCLGSTILSLISVRLTRVLGTTGDPARLAAQIVSGIGFLGAGAIVREGNSVRGLTTAASIWTTSAIGIAVGAGAFFAQLAVLSTGVVLFALWALHSVDQWVDRRGVRPRIVEATLTEHRAAAGRLITALTERSVRIRAVDFEHGAKRGTEAVAIRVAFPAGFDADEFIAAMAQDPGIAAIEIE